MSRASCISHPEGERLILVRKWQLEACGKDACAAALLNLFEYWHNIKLEQYTQAKGYNEIAQRHGENSTQIQTFLQWHTTEQLENSILNIFNKRRIQAGIEVLVTLGFISVHRNPNPRYAFDKTKHFLFHPEKVRVWLENYSFANAGFSKESKSIDVITSEDDSSMVPNECIDKDNLHQSIDMEDTNDIKRNDIQMVQFDPDKSANCTMQYTKNTYQDYKYKLHPQTHISQVEFVEKNDSTYAFEIFWEKWGELTGKSVSKNKSFEIFSNIVKNPADPLLNRILEALENQMIEKSIRQKLNLFIPQWPNPSTWLKEARWEDEVQLNEQFYKTEILRSSSGLTPNKQAIKQQREHYLDGQYKTRITGNQDEKSNSVINRQDAIRQFDEEFRRRKGN